MTHRRNPPVLYVHPFGNPHPDAVPYGLIGLMNSLPPGEKLGLYAHELGRQQLVHAKVLLLDLHWIHSLHPVAQTVRAVRSLAPDLPVVLGGYTASLFAQDLVERGLADYVITGDAEVPFPMLVKALLNAEPTALIPNLVTAQGRNERSYHLSREFFDSQDFLTTDWFPSLHARILSSQAQGEGFPSFPIVPTYKGCVPPSDRNDAYCRACYGQPAKQRRLTGRSFVSRSPQRVLQDLRTLSAHDRVRTVRMFFDFAQLGEQYTQCVFSEPFDLDLNLEPPSFCSPAELQRVAASFRSVEFVYYYKDLTERMAKAEPEAVRFLEAARDLGVAVVSAQTEAQRLGSSDLEERYGLCLRSTSQDCIPVPEPGLETCCKKSQYDDFSRQSEAFVVLRTMLGVMPNFMDAMALQLMDPVEDGDERDAAMQNIERGIWAANCKIRSNPIEQQMLAGANPLDLTLFAAPFQLPAEARLRPLETIQSRWLLAAPVQLRGPGLNLEQRSAELCFELAFQIRRAGNPDGIAIHFMTGERERMGGLEYDLMWKMCLPLVNRRPLVPGEPLVVRARIASRLDGLPSCRFEVLE